jgi:ATP-dependent Lon protease
LVRKATRKLVEKGSGAVKVGGRNLEKYAGIQRFRYGEVELEDMVGVTTGLAWTEVGGELLSIEAVMVPGKGKMQITGKLGDVMQESVQAAASFVRARSIEFGIKPTLFEKRDIHVHVPEGATPKDGPSAGVAMATSIVSVLTGNPVRKDVAMTGEITLRGRVLPIGGLKEKLLAALRGGLKTVLFPKENEKDLADIPVNVKKGLELVPIATVDEALKRALVQPLVPIKWEEEERDNKVRSDKPEDDRDAVMTH